MKAYSISALALLFLSTSVASAAVLANCGDGNQRYTADSHTGPVRYFADVNEFTITRGDTADSVIVTDSVKCRYGSDTLVGISEVEFLEKSFSLEELLTHQRTKELTQSVVRTFLFDNVSAQISRLGVDPFAEDTNESYTNSNTIYSNTAETYTNNSYASSNSYNNSTNYSTDYSDLGFTFTPNSSYSGQSSNTNSYSNYSSSSYSPYSASSISNVYSQYSTGTYYNSGLGTGISSAPAGQVQVRWNSAGMNPNAIVYVEAVDRAGARHYLGSAIAGEGQRTFDIPSFLGEEESLTMYIRSGNRVIDIFDVEL